MTLTDQPYTVQGAEAPEPRHEMTRYEHLGTYGEHPSPAEASISCTCGEGPLWEWVEGYGSTPGTPLDAFEDHLREVEG